MINYLKTLRDWFVAAPKLNAQQRSDLYAGIAARAKMDSGIYDTIAIMGVIANRNNKEHNKLYLPDALLERFGGLGKKLSGKKDPVFSRVLAEALTALGNGQPLSSALANAIPARELIQIEAAEMAGTLANSCERLCKGIEREALIIKAIATAVAYPLLLLGMLAYQLHYFATTLIPSFGQLIPPEKLTPNMQNIFSAGAFFREWSFMLVVLGGAIVIAVLLGLPNYTGRFRAAIDRTAPFSFYRIFYGAAFLDSLSILLSSGVSLDDSLQALNKNNSPWLTSRISAIQALVQSGHSLGDAMDKAGKTPGRENEELGHCFPDAIVTESLLLRGVEEDTSAQLNIVIEQWYARIVQVIEKASFT